MLLFQVKRVNLLLSIICYITTMSYTGNKVLIPLFNWEPNIYFYCCLLGNEIEWKYPTSVNLIGVEFKALASGSHTITKDFM